MFPSSTFLSAAPVVANGASSDPNEGKEKEIDDGGSTREEIPDEVDGSTHLIQVKTLKRIDMVNEFSSAGFHGVFLSFFLYICVDYELFLTDAWLFMFTVTCIVHVYSSDIRPGLKH